MAAPLKSKIQNALGRLEAIETFTFETHVQASKSALENAIILETNLEGIQAEISASNDAFSEIENANSLWADLLRKMSPEEREAGNKESSKFQDTVAKKIEQAEAKFKELKALEIAAKKASRYARAIATSEQEVKDKQAAINHAQALAAIAGPGAAPHTAPIHYSLPTLQLKKFTGNREQWPEFWEGYKSAVHSRPMEDAEKFNLLRSFLDGEPKKIIEGLPLKGSNYAIALKLLLDHYGDEETYIRILYGQLSELRTCRSFEDVKAFAIELERISRQLEGAGQKIDDPSVYIPLEKKLTAKFLREILKKKANDKNAWTTAKFRKALAETILEEEAVQCVLKEATTEKRGKEPDSKRGKKEVLHTVGTVEGRHSDMPNRMSKQPAKKGITTKDKKPEQASSQRKSRRPCIFCQKDHWDADCPLPLEQRKKVLRESKRCYKCLDNGHFASQCRRAIKCRSCNGNHPTALCAKPTQKVSAAVNSEEKEPDPVHANAIQDPKAGRKALLMTTRATVFNPKSPKRSTIASIFIDGGSHRSFVNKTLVEQIGLPVLATEECLLAGFGEKKAKHYTIPLVQLGMLTETGEKMILPLNSLDFIVRKMPIVELSKVDEERLKKRRLDIEMPSEQPQILLGIDVFNELHIKPVEKLPSGFTISTSQLGKILSGEGIMSRSHKAGSFPAISFESLTGVVLYDSGDEAWDPDWSEPESGDDSENEYIQNSDQGELEPEQISPAKLPELKLEKAKPQGQKGGCKPPSVHDWTDTDEDSGSDSDEHSFGFTIISSNVETPKKEPATQSESKDQNQNQTSQQGVALQMPFISEKGLNEAMDEFFGLQTVGLSDSLDPDEKDEVLKHFKANLVFIDGRYQVGFPWNERVEDLPSNYKMAKARLKNTLKQLKQNPEHLLQYQAILDEQLKRGIIEIVNDPSLADGPVHYLPHRAVIRNDKSTTKVRIVMDGSAKPKTMKGVPSLNDCLHTGPPLLKDLTGILLRWRQMPIVILADIEKAFLMVGVRPQDRDATRFLWVSNPESVDEDNILYEHCIVFRFTRVSFGLNCSPFLLNATIGQHLEFFDSEVARAIKENIYVDNVLIGTESMSEIPAICQEAQSIFSAAGMHLREFMSNEPEGLQRLEEADKAKNTDTTKILGVYWNVKLEGIVVPFPKFNGKITKRTVLSHIASIFDPQGLISPALLPGKLFLQKLWAIEKKWDDELPCEFQEEWHQLMLEWTPGHETTKVTFQRYIGHQKELHTFADASGHAMGVAVILKTEEKPHLIYAKSLVKPVKLPVKAGTIPKLELQALAIAVKVTDFVRKEIKIPDEQITLWTDSKCCIDQLRDPKKHDRFTENRLQKIRGKWPVKHLISKDNPADVASRGTTPQELDKSAIWKFGPTWLSLEKPNWPNSLVEYLPGDELLLKNDEEEKEEILQDMAMAIAADPEIPSLIEVERFSSWNKLRRSTVYVFRFLKKVAKDQPLQTVVGRLFQQESASEEIAGSEIGFAEIFLIKEAQKRHPPSINQTTNLRIYVENDELMRCRGRIDESSAQAEAKRPILLPREDRLTHLIIKHFHQEKHHCGPNNLLGILRQQFWIPQGRRTLNWVIFHSDLQCLNCKKFRMISYQKPEEPNIPASRMQPARPFENTGVDYFGPLRIKTPENDPKVWVALFTCMVTRCIHLELATDLSGEAFLRTYRRFIARRGVPTLMMSDNGTQFVLASKTIMEIWKEAREFGSNSGTKWRFIPPRTPNYGGYWEKMVGIVKYSLKRTVGRSLLSADELGTLLTEIEATVNTRPLTFQSEQEPNRMIRPVDFLIPFPGKETCLPLIGQEDEEWVPKRTNQDKLKSMLEKAASRIDKFWKIWLEDYLLSLRERIPNTHEGVAREPSLNEPVLVEEEDAPRNHWRIGIVKNFKRGRDGKIRTALIFTNGRNLERPLNMLYPLEMEPENKGEIVAFQMAQFSSNPHMPFADEEDDRDFIPMKVLTPAEMEEDRKKMIEEEKRWAEERKEEFAARRKEREEGKAKGKERKAPDEPEQPMEEEAIVVFINEEIAVGEELEAEEDSGRANNKIELVSSLPPAPVLAASPATAQANFPMAGPAVARRRHEGNNSRNSPMAGPSMAPRRQEGRPGRRGNGNNRHHANRPGFRSRSRSPIRREEMPPIPPPSTRRCRSMRDRNLVLNKGHDRGHLHLPCGLFTQLGCQQPPTVNELGGSTRIGRNFSEFGLCMAYNILHGLLFNFLIRHQQAVTKTDFVNIRDWGSGEYGAKAFFRQFQRGKGQLVWKVGNVTDVVRAWMGKSMVLYNAIDGEKTHPECLWPSSPSDDPEFDGWLRAIEDTVNTAIAVLIRDIHVPNAHFINSGSVAIIGDTTTDFLQVPKAVKFDGNSWDFRAAGRLFFGPKIKHVILTFIEDIGCEDALAELLGQIRTPRASVVLHHRDNNPQYIDLAKLGRIAQQHGADLIWTNGDQSGCRFARQHLGFSGAEAGHDPAAPGPSNPMPDNGGWKRGPTRTQWRKWAKMGKAMIMLFAILFLAAMPVSCAAWSPHGLQVVQKAVKTVFGGQATTLPPAGVTTRKRAPQRYVVTARRTQGTPTTLGTIRPPPPTTQGTVALHSQTRPTVRATMPMASFTRVTGTTTLRPQTTRTTSTQRPTLARVVTRPAPRTTKVMAKTTSLAPTTTEGEYDYEFNAKAEALVSSWEPKMGKIHEHVDAQKERIGLKADTGSPIFWCSSEGSTILQIKTQDVDPFCREAPSIFSKWINLTLPVYSRIKDPVPVQKTYICSVKKETDSYYTNLFGDKFLHTLHTEIEIMQISSEECRRMAEHFTCERAKPDSKMTAESDHFWSTKNKAQINFPGNIASLWKGEQRAVVINCLVQSAVLYYRPHNLEMVSPLFNVRHCRYQTESCVLDDNSTLLWEADCQNSSCSGCDFEKLKDWDGEFTAQTKDTPATWVSKDRELALTFSDNPPRTKGCDNVNLRMSDQGYGIPKEQFQSITSVTRQKRGVKEDQLAAQLTASQIQTTRAIQQLFGRECRRSNRAENPTLLARKLLKKETLQARWLTEKELEVWSCVEVPLEQLSFRAMQKCYRYIPVTVNFPEKQLKIDAFLDPVLRIVSSTAAEADCLHYRFHLIEKRPGIWFRIDSQQGKVTLVPASSVYQVYETVPDKTGGILDLKPLIFHELVLSNSTEIFPHVDELIRFQNWKNKVAQEKTSKATTLGALPYGIKGLALELWAEWWAFIRDHWVYAACGYSTFLFVTEVLIPLCTIYVFGPCLDMIARIGNPSRRWERSERSERTNGRRGRRQRKTKRRQRNSQGDGEELQPLGTPQSPQFPYQAQFPMAMGQPMALMTARGPQMAIGNPMAMLYDPTARALSSMGGRVLYQRGQPDDRVVIEELPEGPFSRVARQPEEFVGRE